MSQNGSESNSVLFFEEQRMRQKWVWLIVGIVTAIGWAAFIQQIVFGNPVGNRPAPNYVVWLVFILFGIGMPWLMYSLKLITRVQPSQVVVRFRPLLTRRFPIEDIVSCAARTYRPMREFGGWGLRFSPKYGRAYNMHGNRGVQLVLKQGRKILIGSQRPEDLAEAINQQRSGS
jgi:hypothetical protein